MNYLHRAILLLSPLLFFALSESGLPQSSNARDASAHLDPLQVVRASDFGAPPDEKRFEWYAQQAKKRGKKQVILPGGMFEIMGSNRPLIDVLRSYDVLDAVLVGKHSQKDDAHMTTWYRFRIARILQKCSTCADTTHSAVVESTRPPLRGGEFYVGTPGGTIQVAGITITEPFEDFSPPTAGKHYLLFARLAPDGVASVAGDWEGIFALNGDSLTPLYKMQSKLRSDLDLNFASSFSSFSDSLKIPNR